MRKLIFASVLIATVLFVNPFGFADTPPVYASTFTVTNANDSGSGSLRQAIQDANANPGADVINFSFSGTIVLQSSFLLTDTGTVIDGAGYNITINGSALPPGSNAFNVTVPSATFKHLTIHNAPANGISVNDGFCTNTVDGINISNTVIQAGGTGLFVCGSVVKNVSLTGSTINAQSNNAVNISGNSANTNIFVNNNPSLVSQNRQSVRIGNNQATNSNIQINQNGTIQSGQTWVAISIAGLTNTDIEISNNTVLKGDWNAIEVGKPSATNNTRITIHDNGAIEGQSGGGIYIKGNSNSVITVSGNNSVIARAIFPAVEIDGQDNNLIQIENNAFLQGIGGDGVFVGNYSTAQPPTANNRNLVIRANVIMGSQRGIRIKGASTASGNVISENNIYQNATGIELNDSNVKVWKNSIHDNAAAAIAVPSGMNNWITQNSVYSNSGLGIDLDGAGVTLNDPGDADTGANNLQNFPTLTSVTSGGGSTTIEGILNSTPNTPFTLEFFSTPTGTLYQGKTFLGSFNVTTNGNGDAPFSATFPISLPSGEVVSATATDPNHNTSEFTPYALGPIIATIEPMQVNTAFTASASFEHPGNPPTAVWDWGDGTTSAGNVSGGNGVWSVGGSHNYTMPGVYAVKLTATFPNPGSVVIYFQYVVVYDPTAGFVTGGGWINSPIGAYVPAPTLTGKATFGFVAKYEKGANTPSGQTQFKFHVANLDFASTDYQWLVVAGAKAQYKGSGKINGSGDYDFMLTAIDGQLSGGGDIDKFRIKIWNRAGGGIVYDNQVGASETADPVTALGGGSIVIHK